MKSAPNTDGRAGQTSFMPNRDLATNPSPEKPDGEGWLANADLQKIVQFKPDAPTAHGQWVILRDIPLAAAGLPDSPDAQTDAPAQRH